MEMRVACMGRHRRLVAVDVNMRATVVMFVDMKMDSPLAHPAHDVEAEQNQHDADGKFQRRRHAVGQGQPQQDHRRADGEQRNRVAQTPDRTAQHQSPLGPVRADRHGADGRQMIGFQRVLHAEQKPERQKTFQDTFPLCLCAAVDRRPA